MVSAPLSDISHPNAGAVYVIGWTLDVLALPMSFDPEASVPGARVLRIRGQQADDWFGFALAGGADVLGDSTPDLLIGAPSGPVPDPLGGPATAPPTSGKLFAVDGGILGAALAAVPESTVADFALVTVEVPVPVPLPANVNALLVRGEAIGSRFGHSICVIGNLDVSTHPAAEIAVGAIGAWWQCGGPSQGMQFAPGDLGQGSVKVFSISTSYVPTERKRLVGEAQGDFFGFSVSGFGVGLITIGADATGDGVFDLLVGAPANDDGGPSSENVGEIYLYSGATLQGGGSVQADFSAAGSGTTEYFGWDVAGGVDVTGDGHAEFAGGSRNFDAGVDAPQLCMANADTVGLGLRPGANGRVRVFCGFRKPDGGHDQIDEFWGMQGKGHLGWSLCWLPSMDGNAFPELLMGMPGFQRCVACTDDDPTAEIGRAHIWFY